MNLPQEAAKRISGSGHSDSGGGGNDHPDAGHARSGLGKLFPVLLVWSVMLALTPVILIPGPDERRRRVDGDDHFSLFSHALYLIERRQPSHHLEYSPTAYARDALCILSPHG